MAGKLGGRKTYAKACMRCKSVNIKIFQADDNAAFGLNPKYECLDCGAAAMPIEIPLKKK